MSSYHCGICVGSSEGIKVTVDIDWHGVMGHLLPLVECTRNLVLSSTHVQELYVWLHILDVDSVWVSRVLSSYCW